MNHNLRPGLTALFLCIAITSCVTASGRVDEDPVATKGVTSDTIFVCIFDSDTLIMLPVLVDQVRQDTLMPDGTPFRVAHPAGPAISFDSFSGEILRVLGGSYVAYGGERHIPLEQLVRVSEHRGLPVYVEAGRGESPPPAVFIAVKTGCIFQPFIGVSP
jgi:hypothetical protein